MSSFVGGSTTVDIPRAVAETPLLLLDEVAVEYGEGDGPKPWTKLVDVAKRTTSDAILEMLVIIVIVCIVYCRIYFFELCWFFYD
jgi:hypothetical protein